MDLTTKDSYLFTNGAKESSFLELLDGTILFASDRENKDTKEDETKFYRICPQGGEAVLYFTLPVIVNTIKQVNENEFLVLANFNRQKELAKIGKELEEKPSPKEEKKYDDSKDYLIATEIPFWNNGIGFTNENRSRLYYYNKLTAEFTAITDDITDVYSIELNKDRDKAVFISASYTGVFEGVVIRVSGGSIHADPHHCDQRPNRSCNRSSPHHAAEDRDAIRRQASRTARLVRGVGRKLGGLEEAGRRGSTVAAQSGPPVPSHTPGTGAPLP